MKRLAPAIAAIALTACIPAAIVTETTVTYVAPAGISVDSVAILPVSTGDGLEGFRRLIADSLAAALRHARPALVVLGADTVLSRLNVAGAAESYAQMMRDYSQTSILDQHTLAAIAQVAGARDLLYIRAAYGEARSVAGNFITGYSSQRDQDLTLFVHIWDGRRGDVVWEASTHSKVSAGEVETSRGLDEILADAVRSLANRFAR